MDKQTLIDHLNEDLAGELRTVLNPAKTVQSWIEARYEIAPASKPRNGPTPERRAGTPRRPPRAGKDTSGGLGAPLGDS